MTVTHQQVQSDEINQKEGDHDGRDYFDVEMLEEESSGATIARKLIGVSLKFMRKHDETHDARVRRREGRGSSTDN